MQQSACLVVNPITVNNFAVPLSLHAGGSGVRFNDGPRHKAIYFSWSGPELFCLLLGLPGFSCFFFFFAPVVLFDTPGVSRCRSQHVVSVATSSVFHHSLYLWFIWFPWWSIELENLHADRTTLYFEPRLKMRATLGSRKTGLTPLPVV